MVGLATGDAYGCTYEFKKPGSFVASKEIVGDGPHNLKAGMWTDDTSMALCLAESIIKTDGFDPIDQMQLYVKWYKNGYMSCKNNCFDIGNTILKALEHFIQTGKTAENLTGTYNAGNGSIMRLAPVPLFYADNLEETAAMSAASSKTTHGNILAVDACRLLGIIIASIIQGKSKDEVLSDTLEPAPGYWRKYPMADEIAQIHNGSYKESTSICGSGYVVKSLEAALWAFYSSDTFEQGCRMAVNLGDDTDTTAAVYGQIAGAYYGIEAIPENWKSKVFHLNLIESMADTIHQRYQDRISR